VPLTLDAERCVHARSVSASCRACVDACPTRAITLTGAPQRSVRVDLEACTACGLCQAACPTEALPGGVKLDALGERIRCGEGLACVGALSVEDLVVLGLRGPHALVAAAGCTHGTTGHRQARVEEANALLRAIGSKHELAWREEGPPGAPFARPPRPEVPARRQFFQKLVAADRASTLTAPPRLDPSRVRAQYPTGRRKRTLAALPAAASPKVATVPTPSFTSSKVIDEATCTGCVACVTACPTGALTSTRTREVIRFDTSRCVKCHLCHDVCAPGAIHLAPALDVTAFLELAPRALVTLRMRPCEECGQPFKVRTDGGARCATCEAQDAEARELQGRT
jgi:formate hydrogenlyase subunit 6/NADH:ubiquinone oxidoreductase subunit I